VSAYAGWFRDVPHGFDNPRGRHWYRIFTTETRRARRRRRRKHLFSPDT